MRTCLCTTELLPGCYRWENDDSPDDMVICSCFVMGPLGDPIGAVPS